MGPDTGHALEGRAGLLLIAPLAAFLWLLIGIFGAADSAAASEDQSPDALLGTLAGAVEELTPTPAVTAPIVAVIDTGVVDPVTDTVAAPITEAVALTVLDQPVVTETLEVVNDLVTGPAEALRAAYAPSNAITINLAPAATSAAAIRPEPAAVLLTAAADTRAAQVPAAGSTDTPVLPVLPSAPAAPVASASGVGGPALLAAVSGFEDSGSPERTSATPQNDILPSSLSLDEDTSPD